MQRFKKNLIARHSREYVFGAIRLGIELDHSADPTTGKFKRPNYYQWPAFGHWRDARNTYLNLISLAMECLRQGKATYTKDDVLMYLADAKRCRIAAQRTGLGLRKV